ncbi:hypothetical protein ACHAW5_000957 [Stephanodiscus triporus]|uniref:N-acetyltransferase domain-containing protein n=1 Tax=Stephanodiscus triporus TaxID=2934178 RepID=A0ABD3NBM9_9STRA
MKYALPSTSDRMMSTCTPPLPSPAPPTPSLRLRLACYSVYDETDEVNLNLNLKSFCEADQITRDGYVCVVATEGGGKGKGKGGERVLGTADLNAWTGVVNNVYVREEARKRGIARSMMTAVEEYYCAATAATAGGRERDGGGRKRRKLTLAVMSKNLPAVTLYKSLGYAATGIYGGLDALSSMSPLNFLIEMEKEI